MTKSVGHSIQRISNFENEILNLLSSNKNNVLSWCILPNHYHLLLYTENLGDFRKRIYQSLNSPLEGGCSY